MQAIFTQSVVKVRDRIFCLILLAKKVVLGLVVGVIALLIEIVFCLIIISYVATLVATLQKET